MSGYSIHPAAAAFPAMSKDELQELANDIERHGQLVPIELYDGQVIDGRHRQEACGIVNVAPEYVEVDLHGRTPEEYAWSLNGPRRHMTASQKAAVASELVPHYRQEARERQAHGKTAPGRTLMETLPEALECENNGENGTAYEKAAQHAGVSEKYVRQAAKLKETDPDLHEEVKQGRKTLSAAMKESERRAKEKAAKPSDASVVLDSIGREVPKNLVEPYEKSVVLATIGRKIDAIRREVEEVSNGPGGEHLSMSNINDYLKRAKAHVVGGAYFTDCPKCKRKVKDDCDRCTGAGFISKDHRGRLSDAEKGWLGI